MTGSHQTTLAMPVGLPPTGADPATFYAELKQRVLVQVAAAKTAQIWVANDDAYTSLFAMCRGVLSCLPAGGASPHYEIGALPALLLRIWPTDYVDIRRNALGRSLPKAIGYGNADPSSVADTVRVELSANPRYGSLTDQDRTQTVDTFMAGTSHLLVDGGTRLGRAAVDASPSLPAAAGSRRLDLTFLDDQGLALDPNSWFDVWGLISGPLVRGHPLLDVLSSAARPAIAPVEGGNRMRVLGTGLVDGTIVEIGGQAATEVATSPDGTVLFATTPANPPGPSDLVVSVPGTPPTTLPGAVTYVTDVVATARAAIASYVLTLGEIRARAKALDSAGALDDGARQQLHLDLDGARNLSSTLVAIRDSGGGGSWDDPAIGTAWQDADATAQSLLAEIQNVIGWDA